MKSCKVYCFFLMLFCFSCGSLVKNVKNISEREFRGVWIASVVNIDWPKSGKDPIEKQQNDFIKILEFYKKLHFNAVIVQIRTAGDALYPSKLAPWSRYLTGEEGTPPQPYYDPLAWMINEAHQRGFEFHAWLNPYRATFDLKKEKLSPTHDYVQHPDWMIRYGKKYYYNPGLPEVQQHLTNIIDEVVTNYDIDAVHFDDYFYPYQIKDEVFDDQLSYQQYAKPDQTLDDWRRENINMLIQNAHAHIKTKKPWVQFGVSPFGVWRNSSIDPSGSDTQADQTTYDHLYADPITWMQNGWIDYLAPQLYWSMDYPVAAHRKLMRWWDKNSPNTNLYIGNGAYKVRKNKDSAWFKNDELLKQVNLARKHNHVQGNIFFSAKSLQGENEDIAELLAAKVYTAPVLTPALPTSKQTSIPAPKVVAIEHLNENVTFTLEKNNDISFQYVVVSKGKKEKNFSSTSKIIDKIYIVAKKERIKVTMHKDKLESSTYIGFTYIDHYRRESFPYIINLNDL